MNSLKNNVSVNAKWISRALHSSGYIVDFSINSLHEIDRFYDEHSEKGAARRGGLLADDLGPRIFALGSYIGEVVRRVKGGEWIGDYVDGDGEVNINLHLPDGTRCWPVQRAAKRLANGRKDSIVAWAVELGVGMEVSLEPRGFVRRMLRLRAGKPY